MPIIANYLVPTVDSKVIAPTRVQRKMTQPEFYEADEYKATEQPTAPETSSYLSEELGRFRQRTALPDLQPSARVTEPQRDTDRSKLQSFYNRLELTKQMGLDQLESVRVKSALASAVSPTGGYTGHYPGDGHDHSHDHGYTGKWNIGKVLPHVALAAQEIGNKFGIATIHGIGSRPNKSFHPLGRALDFMTGNNISKGNSITSYVLGNRARLGVTEVIWNGQYWSGSNGWKPVPYTGKNPHRDHPHVSFRA
jgi:hypothetical protein